MHEQLKQNRTPFDVNTILRSAPAEALLIDSYERVVGTPMEMGYDELVLSAYSDDRLLLEHYVDGGLDSERITAYLVPLRAAHDAYGAVADAGMERWNERSDVTAICGKSYVCKFRGNDGEYTRVSSEAMPAIGVAAFNAVRSALRFYLREEYRR